MGSRAVSSAKLPPLRALLKSRDVEDPVDHWVHRPLAYAIVWAVFRTWVAPAHVTLLAAFAVLLAAGLWVEGSPGAMVAGGILLWLSAILDDADGMLARARGQQSQYGRALDGLSDAVVGAVVALAGFYHCYVRSGDPIYWYIAPLAMGTTWSHIQLYEFFKESYLRSTRPGKGGEGQDIPELRRHFAALERRDGAPLTKRFLKHALFGFLGIQQRLVSLFVPGALREDPRSVTTPESADIFQRYNRGPMRLWSLISLAPHTLLMALFGIFDQLEIYVWLRVVPANLLFIVVVIWQRRAASRTAAEQLRASAASILVSET